MAYGDPLDPATPADGNYAGQGDDRMRELKRAVIQRLLTVFKDVNADPLELIDEFIKTIAIQARAVTGPKIALEAIIEEHYGPDSIPRAALKDAIVGTAELIDEEVTTPKIAPLAITLAKLANELDLSTKLKDASIPYGKLDPPFNVAGKVQIYGPHLGHALGGGEVWDTNADGSIRNAPATSDSTFGWRMPIITSVGDHIRKVRARFYRGHAASAITAKLMRYNTGAAVEEQALAVPAGLGWNFADTGAIDEEVLVDSWYGLDLYLEVTGGDVDNIRFLYMEVTIDRVSL